MIKIKRESWKNGLHSVARLNGKWVATRRWHGKKDTERVKDIVVHIESFRETYKPSKPVQPSFTGFRKSKNNLDIFMYDRYVYLIQAKFDGGDVRTYSMTSSQLYNMDKDMKINLFSAARHAYGDSPAKFRLLKIYNSRIMQNVKTFIGQRYQ